MQKFKTLTTSRLAVFLGGAALALVVAWPLIGTAQDKSGKAKDPDPHAVHKDKPPAGDQTLASEIADLRAKVARLEAAIGKGPSGMPADAGGMAGMASAKGGMASMGPAKKGMSGMGAAPAGKGMASGGGGMGDMMGMMSKMMGMMASEMGGMGGGGMMKDEMGGMGGGAMAAGGAPSGMGMMEDDMDMMGMMGMGSMGAAAPKGMKSMGQMKMASALPSFPGASHIYHIGAAGFFLNHPEHITLTTKQQAKLNTMKQKALLAKSTAQRKIDEAEQELWELTGSDEPDAAQIQTKLQAIEKLRGEQRMAFIAAVGESAKVLTDEQRQTLMGTMSPDATKAPAPASK